MPAFSLLPPPPHQPARLPSDPPPQDQDGKEMGVAGTMEQVSWRNFSSQPINSMDWSPDKQGLFVCSAFDQCLRVGIATKLASL